jgi:hypothetical protein
MSHSDTKGTLVLSRPTDLTRVVSHTHVPCALALAQIYYVGGYGVLSKWLDVQDYQAAKPDILADHAARIAAKVCFIEALQLHIRRCSWYVCRRWHAIAWSIV